MNISVIGFVYVFKCFAAYSADSQNNACMLNVIMGKVLPTGPIEGRTACITSHRARFIDNLYHYSGGKLFPHLPLKG